MEHFSNAKGRKTEPLKVKVIEFCINKCGILPCISFKVGLNTKMLTFLLLGNRTNYSSDSMYFFQKHKMKWTSCSFHSCASLKLQ